MAKIESLRNSNENGERKTIKRKVLAEVSANASRSPTARSEERTVEGTFEEEDLLGTIDNEDDSSDDSDDQDAESGLDDDPDVENSDESEELSFEEDSEDEDESEINMKLNASYDIQLEKHVPSTSSGKLKDSDIEKVTKTLNLMASISKDVKDSGNKSDQAGSVVETRTKVSSSKSVSEKSEEKKKKKTRNQISNGMFVKPDPRTVLCGLTEDEEKEDKAKIPNEEWDLDFRNKNDFVPPKISFIPPEIVLEKKKEIEEYDYDTSDEEDIRNTVGNIPMSWYDDYKHLGYNWDGNKILKPPKGDEIDNFMKKMEDPNFWRTVKDPQTGQDVVLCNADAELIKRLKALKIPDSDFNEYAPWVEWFSSEVMKTPVRNFPEHKRSFIPSKQEARKVSRIVHAIKMGWIKPKPDKPKGPQFYMLWESDDSAEHMRRIHNHIPAPKRHLPMHAESYNPPPEYLFDNREMKLWTKLEETPWKRKLHFIPQKHSSLRDVSCYDRYVQERFLRCMDLYLCPRARKMRLLIQPEDLVPQLPSPKDLQPFPTTLALVYKGHSDMVRCITVEPKGQYIASGSDDLSVKIWEVATGRCIRTIPAGGVVRSISWCPNPALSLLAVAADRKLLLLNPNVGDSLIVKKTDALLEEAPEQDVLVPEKVKAAIQWEQAVGQEWRKGIRIVINHCNEIKQVTWHGRGDYFSTVMPEGQNRSVLIHQVSKRRSQIPFNRAKGLVQCVLFHPIRPVFFVATQKHVRVYDLVKQEIVKKLFSNSQWISSMAIHPGGDNLLVATYDRKILWFDLDLSTKPYQILRLHGCAVRGIAFHKRYPLFASGSDDNHVIVSHGMVYNDLLQNPLIVPLKRMSHHEMKNDFSVFEVLYHPSQPWLFSSGADGTVRLYT